MYANVYTQFQEMASARKATVHCGHKVAPWKNLVHAISVQNPSDEDLQPLEQSVAETISQNFKSFNLKRVNVLMSTVTNMFQKSVDGSVLEPTYDLETLVSRLRFFESSDPRDTIFALINMSKESSMLEAGEEHEIEPPKVDYGKSLLEVYTDFLEWVVYSSNSLDVLCRQWAIPQKPLKGGGASQTPLAVLPSWIQCVPGSPWSLEKKDPSIRITGDSIVGPAGKRVFDAAYGQKPDVRFGRKRSQKLEAQQLARTSAAPTSIELRPEVAMDTPTSADPRSPEYLGRSPAHQLYAKGIDIGGVMWTSERVSNGVITQDCLEKGGLVRTSDELSTLPEKLLCTLVAYPTVKDESLPPSFLDAAQSCMKFADKAKGLGIHELLKDGTFPKGKRGSRAVNYLKRVEVVTRNRKFFEAMPKGFNSEDLYGLSPPDTQPRDRICILFGCSVPCVLRPHRSNDKTEHWEFVGEAYIHGKMHGEAITALSEDELRARTTEFLVI